jgi:SOS response regulatory protein OraA/RecX
MPGRELRNFFNFLKSRTDPDEDSAFVQKLKDLVDESNEKEDVRKRKMTLEYEINEAAQERAKEMADTIVAERVEDDRLETARNMLNRGFSPDLVADCTRLSLEQVERLKENL